VAASFQLAVYCPGFHKLKTYGHEESPVAGSFEACRVLREFRDEAMHGRHFPQGRAWLRLSDQAYE
jgi:hypothetical protein